MIRVNVRSDIDKLVAKLQNVRREQLPFAIAKAVTGTAKVVAQKLNEELPRAFDRPTPYTQGSVRFTFATKQRPISVVMVRDDASRGTPPAKYLAAQVAGGPRRHKKFELALQAAGTLAGYAIPGAAAKIDRFGNVSRSQLTQIFTAAKATKAASTRKKRGRKDGIFIGSPGGGKLPTGVWERYSFGFGSTIKPVLLFTPKAPNYRVRYRFQDIGEKVVREEFGAQFMSAYAQAVASAR